MVVTTRTTGVAFLEFPSVAMNQNGTYICVAVYCSGKKWVQVNFTVLVVDTISSNKQFGMTPAASKSYADVAIIVPMTITPVSAMVIVSIVAILYVKYRQAKRGGLTISEIADFMGGVGSFSNVDSSSATELVDVPNSIPYDKKLEIPSHRFQIDKTSVLGKGAYGIVFKGLLDGRPVAVKTTKDKADVSCLKSLLSELKVMSYLGDHENLVKLMGTYTKELEKGKAYVFVQFCALGSLASYLKKGRELAASNTMSIETLKEFNLKDMYAWSSQLASGMAYLGEKKVIHGDLATRNVLLTVTREVKIIDFGLSQRLYDYAEYVRRKEERVPWRWLALESLQDSIFSCQSDIWSYGVTLWEIFSLGRTPYPNYPSWGIGFINQIETGMRLPKPDYATEPLYNTVMRKCWNADPSLRPSFEEIAHLLSPMCTSVKGNRGYVSHNVLATNPQTSFTSSFEFSTYSSDL